MSKVRPLKWMSTPYWPPFLHHSKTSDIYANNGTRPLTIRPSYSHTKEHQNLGMQCSIER